MISPLNMLCRVPSDMPLYDILNEFQKGSSHMAAVVKVKEKNKNAFLASDGEKYGETFLTSGISPLATPLLIKHDNDLKSIDVDIGKAPRNTGHGQTMQQNVTAPNGVCNLFEDIEDGEIIGIITLEDVFEELLQVSTTAQFILENIYESTNLFTQIKFVYGIFSVLLLKNCMYPCFNIYCKNTYLVSTFH